MFKHISEQSVRMARAKFDESLAEGFAMRFDDLPESARAARAAWEEFGLDLVEAAEIMLGHCLGGCFVSRDIGDHDHVVIETLRYGADDGKKLRRKLAVWQACVETVMATRT